MIIVIGKVYIWFLETFACLNSITILKLTCENFISKGGSVFEILVKIWSGYVHAGRINPNWYAQSEKRVMQKRFPD